MAITKINNPLTTASGTVTDDAQTVYLESRTKSFSGGLTNTTDVWTGHTVAIRELYSEILDDGGAISSINTTQNGCKSTLTVVWGVSVDSGDFPSDGTEETTDEWQVKPVEVPTPLAAHPYFQVNYFPGSGELIEDEIARCESAIKRGRAYVADGAYKETVARYYGLRMAGVEQYIQYGVEITRKRTLSDVTAADDAFNWVGTIRTPAQLGIPGDIITCINRLPKITDYTDPTDPDTYVLSRAADDPAGGFEWLVQAPDMQFNLIDGGAVFEITESYLGLEKWSKVIYPGGSWDPQGEVTT